MTGATAQGAFATKPYSKDPYQYQVGFGNRFASEALYVPLHGLSEFLICADQGFYLMLRIIHRRSNMVFTTKRYGYSAFAYDKSFMLLVSR